MRALPFTLGPSRMSRGLFLTRRTPEAPVNVSPPTISGTAKVGETLTASTGVWAGNPEPTYAYQWNRDGGPIPGAENSTYTLVAADYGAVITVTVTATNSAGSSSETSGGTSAVAGIAPANTVAPSISGTAQVGETLTASAGTWTGVPTPSYSYQWKRDGNSIGGATNSTYQLVAADYGAVITVTVTATNSEGSSSETSAGTSAVAGLAPVNTAAPVISGTPKVGELLSVTTGTWTGVPTPSISYQWTRDESDISGATGSTYTLIEDDEDAMIGCRVTATNAEGSDSADAEEVGPVEAGWLAFFDLTDISNMSQNEGGTTPVTATGHRIGRVVDPVRGRFISSSNGDGTRFLLVSDPTFSLTGVVARANPYQWLDDYNDGGWIDKKMNGRDPWWFCCVAHLLTTAETDHMRLITKQHTSGPDLYQDVSVRSWGGNILLIYDRDGANQVTTDASAVTSGPVVLSAGYDGNNMTVRVNLGTKASLANSTSLPNSSVYDSAWFGDNRDQANWYALCFMDHYPSSEKEEAAIRQAGALAGLSL